MRTKTMNEKTDTIGKPEISTDTLRELARDTSALVGNKFRDAMTDAANEIDRLRVERDQWRKQALEEDANCQQDRKLLDDAAEALKNALMCIMGSHDEEFVDEYGDRLDFMDGGDFSEGGRLYLFGTYSFCFREAAKLCGQAGHPFPFYEGATK